MSETITGNIGLRSDSTEKIINVGLWILQIGAAALFLMVGCFKLAGDSQMVGLFDAIGLGQWFRYVTGGMEVLGGILLLTPRLSGLGALLLIPVMFGAVIAHLFVVGGSPLMAIILLVCATAIALGRHRRALDFLVGLL